MIQSSQPSIQRGHRLAIGLVGWWLFETQAGGYIWKDLVNGRVATPNTYSGTSGSFPATVGFRSNLTWSKTPRRSSLWTTTWAWDTGLRTLSSVVKYSYAFWAKKTATGNRIGMGSSGYGSDNTRDCVTDYVNGTKYVLAAGSYGTFADTDTTNWQHYAVTYDGSETGNANRLKFYLNGTARTLSYAGSIGATSGAHIGTSSTPRYFLIGEDRVTPGPTAGNIDDVKVWNRTLNASEAVEVYTNSVNNFEGLLIRPSIPIFGSLVSTGGPSTHYSRRLLTGGFPVGRF